MLGSEKCDHGDAKGSCNMGRPTIISDEKGTPGEYDYEFLNGQSVHPCIGDFLKFPPKSVGVRYNEKMKLVSITKRRDQFEKMANRPPPDGLTGSEMEGKDGKIGSSAACGPMTRVRCGFEPRSLEDDFGASGRLGECIPVLHPMSELNRLQDRPV